MSFDPFLSNLLPWTICSRVDIESYGKAYSLDDLLTRPNLLAFRQVIVNARRANMSELHLVFGWDSSITFSSPEDGVLKPSFLGSSDPGAWVFQGALPPDPEDLKEFQILYPLNNMAALCASDRALRFKPKNELGWCTVIEGEATASDAPTVAKRAAGFMDTIVLAPGQYDLNIELNPLAGTANGDNWLILQEFSSAGVAVGETLYRGAFKSAVAGGAAFNMSARVKIPYTSYVSYWRLVYHGQSMGSGSSVLPFALLGMPTPNTPWVSNFVQVSKVG